VAVSHRLSQRYFRTGALPRGCLGYKAMSGSRPPIVHSGGPRHVNENEGHPRGSQGRVGLRPPREEEAADVTNLVQGALDRYGLFADDLEVTADASDGTITLAGHVRSWLEHHVVTDAVWMVSVSRTSATTSMSPADGRQPGSSPGLTSDPRGDRPGVPAGRLPGQVQRVSRMHEGSMNPRPAPLLWALARTACTSGRFNPIASMVGGTRRRRRDPGPAVAVGPAGPIGWTGRCSR
jgi:hypothetical protein